jgi:hypothetical protein
MERPLLELWQTRIAKLVASLTNPTGVPDEQ